MKVDILPETLTAIRAARGNCDVFATLRERTSEFLVFDAVYIERGTPRHKPSAQQQQWLPSRAVLRLQLL